MSSTGPRIAPSGGRVVAITGACTYLGSELLRRLEEDRRYARVLALDIRPPAVASTTIDVAPASIALSTSSLTTEAGRSMTSPAAI